jgi:hypothetical protein
MSNSTVSMNIMPPPEPPRTVTARLMGGLGNQLFQIFTTLAYGFETKRKVIFQYSDILTTGRERPTYWNTFLSSLKLFTSNISLDHYPAYNSTNFHYNPIPHFSHIPSFMLNGYFQSYRYFEKHMSIILKIMKFNRIQQKVFNEYSHLFQLSPSSSPTSSSPHNNNAFTNTSFIEKPKTHTHIHSKTFTLSLHFRIGDYILHPDIHPILSKEYYVNALKQAMTDILIQSSTPSFNSIHTNMKLRVLVFSEEGDKEKVDEYLSFIQETIHKMKDEDESNELFQLQLETNTTFIFEFIKVPYDIEDWKQLVCMSLCDHHIIANSTFSWWGAYFKEHSPSDETSHTETHFVYYPHQWFGRKLSDHNTMDLFPPSWKSIYHYQHL